MTDVLTQLKTTVERAVRPVRASGRRKDTMRNELLAHIQQVFDAEAAQPGEEQAAIDRAIERFGDPKELTSQLQQTVPLVERTLFWPLPFSATCENIARRKPGESIFHHAIRFALGLFLLYMVFLVAPVLLLAAFGKSSISVETAAVLSGFLAGFGTIIAVSMPALMFLSHGMLEVMADKWTAGKSLRRLFLYACPLFLAFIATGFALALLIHWKHGYPIFRFEHLPMLFLTAAVFVVSMPVLARFDIADRHRYEQWESLDIT